MLSGDVPPKRMRHDLLLESLDRLATDDPDGISLPVKASVAQALLLKRAHDPKS